jgi:hypothetical protein
LKVNQRLHPGPHPDADQLSIFVEGADTAREHEKMLAHLAECEECRDVVFLMQRPVETVSPAKERPTEWAWQRWFAPAALTGAMLAGLAALLLFIRPTARTPEPARETAVVQQSEIEDHATSAVPNSDVPVAANAQKDRNGPEPSTAAASRAREEARIAAASKTPKPAYGAVPAGGVIEGTVTPPVAPPSSASATAQASAAPKLDAAAGANAVVVQQLPLNGRNVGSLRPVAPPAAAPATTPQDNSHAQQNLPALQVDRLGDPDRTLAGVSGRVTDESGAAIAGATVALRDPSGDTREIATGADGSFRLPRIPAGHYDLTVASPGFRSNQQPLDLKPSELAMLQPVLAVGAVTETVEVTASAAALKTDTASIVSFPVELPSRLPVASSASIGKRMLSLDGAGTLFLSRNAGKSWKKVHPQWTGKAVRIDLTADESAKAKDKVEASGAKNASNVFQLTTDSGSQWTSKDGTHWRSH